MKRIFVSYTTRSNEINIDVLKKVQKILSEFSNSYIELLDENSSKTQESIIVEVDKSDVFLLIESQEIEQSEWVKLEINRAEELNLPIVRITLKELLNDKNEYIKKMLE